MKAKAADILRLDQGGGGASPVKPPATPTPAKPGTPPGKPSTPKGGKGGKGDALAEPEAPPLPAPIQALQHLARWVGGEAGQCMMA